MFLDTIAKHLEGFSVNLTIKKNDDGTLNILMIPKPDKENKDTDKSKLAPLSISGSLEYLNGADLHNQLSPVMAQTKEVIGNINMYQSALNKAEEDKKKKTEKDKKKSTSGSSKKSEKPEDKTVKKEVDVPNPDFIPEDKRNEENPDWSEEYDVDTPEFIKEKKEVPLQKPLI